ncbi:hypothetical protein QJQ45_009498 [Haematococcus lacustris]|nr:hypothetical protein QJQ45_005480 [Haematococcus lacustris]KAJ9526051.1 hypothetical protein QJQ45_009498 [Haematococcus lacustris]
MLKQAKAIHLAFDGCTTKRHGKVLVIRVTAAVPKLQGQEQSLAERAGQSCSAAAPRLTTIFTDVVGVIQLASGTAEAHVRVIMQMLGAKVLSQLHSKLQQLVPIDQQEQQKQQLATYLQQHCAAMEDYYRQHCKRQLDMPHLMAALGGSDPQSCREVAAKVVQYAALRMDEGQSDLGVWDPHCTWRQFQQDIQAMAEGSPCSTELRLHLEVYFLACPTSNAPVESLLQLLKHGVGRFMELPALLEHMSLHTHRSTLNNIDVHDFALQLPKLRAAVRLHEVAAAEARAPATAVRKATAAACSVGVVVVNVGDHASQQRVAAAATTAGYNRVVSAGVPPPQPHPPPQPPPQQPPQQQGPPASPDFGHMYQLALAAIATKGQAAMAQAPAPGCTLRKRTTPAGLGQPQTAAKRKR